jgi:hypothetical protein
VLERAALGADSAAEEAEGRAAGMPASALEATGEPVDPARLDVFRDFVNSLDVEGDQRGGTGSSS